MYIDRVTFYTADYGEEDLVVPSIANRTTALIPTGLTFTATDIYCGRDEVFSYFKVAQNYELLWNRNYMKVEIAASTGETSENVRDWYGWIDSIECISDTPGSYVCAVKWHPDYWRTFIGSVKGGAALVTRRKYVSSEVPGTSRPIQNVPYLYQKADDDFVVPLTDTQTYTDTGGSHYNVQMLHCIMAFIDNYTSGSDERSRLRYAVWPVGYITDTDTLSKDPIFITLDGSRHCPTIYETFTGDFGALFKVDPENVKGVWLSFIPPFRYTWQRISTAPTVYKLEYIRTNSSTAISIANYLEGKAAVFDPDELVKWSYETTFAVNDFMSNEFETYGMFDENGTLSGTFPPGMKCSDGIDARLVVSASGCYQIYRPAGFTAGMDPSASPSQGCEIRIPCMSVPVTGNSWASYVYSGQRDYEISAKRLQIDTAFYKGMMGSASSGAEGAALGTIAGKNMAGPIGLLSAGTGILSSVGGTVTDRMAADSLQQMTDTQKARQSDVLLFYGGTLAPFIMKNLGVGPYFGRLKIDDYSVGQWETYATQYGIEVQETKSDIISYMSTYTGPLQVRNAQLGGVPSRAVKHIKQRLNSGVIFT